MRSRRQGSDSIGLHFRKVIAAHPVEAGLEVGKPEAERPVRREFEKPVEARGDEGLGRGGDGWRITQGHRSPSIAPTVPGTAPSASPELTHLTLRMAFGSVHYQHTKYVVLFHWADEEPEGQELAGAEFEPDCF